MKLKDAMELQALLAADSNYTNPTIWNHGDEYQVETTRADGAKVTAKVSGGELIVEVSNQQQSENMTTTQDKTRHTSGPWERSGCTIYAGETMLACTYCEGNRHLHTIEEDDTIPNSTGTHWNGWDEAWANARLIASAPELLDALRRLTHPMASDEDLTHALAVIAKVEGRGKP